MPNKITIDWHNKIITYWYPRTTSGHRGVSFESMYDMLGLALANGYRQRQAYEYITILERVW